MSPLSPFPTPLSTGLWFRVQDSAPVMSTIYASLERRFSNSDIEEAQRMGEDIVRFS